MGFFNKKNLTHLVVLDRSGSMYIVVKNNTMNRNRYAIMMIGTKRECEEYINNISATFI